MATPLPRHAGKHLPSRSLKNRRACVTFNNASMLQKRASNPPTTMIPAPPENIAGKAEVE